MPPPVANNSIGPASLWLTIKNKESNKQINTSNFSIKAIKLYIIHQFKEYRKGASTKNNVIGGKCVSLNNKPCMIARANPFCFQNWAIWIMSNNVVMVIIIKFFYLQRLKTIKFRLAVGRASPGVETDSQKLYIVRLEVDLLLNYRPITQIKK
jgi:hypothetical protein